MKALDTNVIVRFLGRNDEQRAQFVYQLYKKMENDKEVLWVPLLVVLEIVWVLESVYRVSKEGIWLCSVI